MFRRIDGALMNTVSFGSGPRTFVGVGGWIGNWELWQQPFEQLSRSWRTIAYDHFGAGETVVAADRLTFEGQVDALFAVLDAFDIEQCTLGGESNGGTVAMAAALRAPDRFSSLVIVDGPHSGFDDPATYQFMAGLKADFPATITGFVDMCVPEADCEHVKRWARDILLRSDADSAVQLLKCMLEVDLRARLPEIQIPTLVIHGELDPLAMTRLAAAEETVALIPNATLHVVKGAGHVPTLTRPDEVVRVIEDFVTGLAP
ncbi:MAG: alpha/beta fold hydrolase [Acidimicrobiales bacterium]